MLNVGQVQATAGLDMRGFMTGINTIHKEGMKVADDIRRKFDKVGQQMRNVGRKMSIGISLPLIGAGTLAVKTAADYETLRVSMNTLNGSVEEGARNFERLKEFSARTPFQLGDLAQAQNMLQGFGMAADDAFQSIKMIGDIAAVSGGSIEGIGIAFGQAAAEGMLMTRDIRQLINQGVPAIKLLADTMNVAESEIFDLASQGEISFDILNKAFQEATSEGGMFADGMAKQAQTIGGVFSTLKDNVSLALGEIGSTLSEELDIKGIMKSLTKNIQKGIEWFGSLTAESKKLAVALAGIGVVAGPAIAVVGILASAISAIMSPVVLTTAAVTALGVGFVWLYRNMGAFADRMPRIAEIVRGVSGGIQFLVNDMGALVRRIRNTVDAVNDLVYTYDDWKKENKDLVDSQPDKSDAREFESFSDTFRAIGDGVIGVAKNIAGSFFDFAEDTEESTEKAGKSLSNVSDAADETAKQLQKIFVAPKRIADDYTKQIGELGDELKELAALHDLGERTGMILITPDQSDRMREISQEMAKLRELSKDVVIDAEIRGMEQVFDGIDITPPQIEISPFMSMDTIGGIREAYANLESQLTEATTQAERERLITKMNALQEMEENMRGGLGRMKDDLSAWGSAARDIATKFTDSFGRGMANIVVQGEKLTDVLENIGKLLLSSAIQTGIRLLLMGSTGGTGGLLGAAFGGSFHTGGIVPGVGEKNVIVKGGEAVLTQQQLSALGDVQSGSMTHRIQVDVQGKLIGRGDVLEAIIDRVIQQRDRTARS